MMGAIIGDIVGSIYEFDNIKTKDFPLFQPTCAFTDDTVMTIAVADAIMQGEPTIFGIYDADTGGISKQKDGTISIDATMHEGILVDRNILIDCLKRWGRMYPDLSYGNRFSDWLFSDSREPYNSFGNGSAMRVSPCPWVCCQTMFTREGIGDVKKLATMTAVITHNHPEGIKGAVEVAKAEWFMIRARTSSNYPDNIDGWKRDIIKHSGYDLTKTLDEIRPDYSFDETCQGTVPQAITAFLESIDFEDAIRNAVSLGGDSDTLAAITGGIAEAAYGIPNNIVEEAMTFLDDPIKEVIYRWQAFTKTN